LSWTATAFSEMSYSPVTLALGALSCSQDLKALRWDARSARWLFTDELEKSIFFPAGGRVLLAVLSGAAASWTSALALSMVAPLGGASLPMLPELVVDPAPAGTQSAAMVAAAVAAPTREKRRSVDIGPSRSE
jgi:hypothetical protein